MARRSLCFFINIQCHLFLCLKNYSKIHFFWNFYYFFSFSHPKKYITRNFQDLPCSGNHVTPKLASSFPLNGAATITNIFVLHVNVSESKLTQKMRRSVDIVSLAANYSDSDIFTLLKLARSFVFKIRSELTAAGINVGTSSHRSAILHYQDALIRQTWRWRS